MTNIGPILHNVEPDPERVTSTLRDTGYDFNDAVADIVDNSIAAEATRVNIELELDPNGDLVFSVTDDGIGMNSEGLVNALRYGSARRSNAASLGKFGIGLNTASTAFARAIHLTSRNETDGAFTTAVWDLDHVPARGWNVEELSEADANDSLLIEDIAGHQSGTTVRWKKIDRVLRAYRLPVGMHAQKAVERLSTSLGEHLGMVFQRFLDLNDSRAANVEIAINDVLVSSWDPFRPAGQGDPISEKILNVSISETEKAPLTLRVFILPSSKKISELYGDAAASSIDISNKKQGIYVYREDRLIHGPDWLGIWAQEPHSSICRVELSFDHRLDEAFQVDIKKSSITLDNALLDNLEKRVAPFRREAIERTRQNRRQPTPGVGKPNIHAGSDETIREKAQDIGVFEPVAVDTAANTAAISNRFGSVRVKFFENENQRAYVDPVESLTDGILYEPAFVGGNQGVRVNTSHPFYEKVYLAHKDDLDTIQALDSLLWALASAEFANTRDSNKALFVDMRYEVARALRRLVEDLPEPEEEDI
ncbi:ATP-binding protein [Agreia sp. Leaf283]|uniref:ATP-binding protein n=1 Tax=Agreia sp. Leaf283 TaxID=1736321 RepID=UPI0006F20EC3|nr:ATP-binding protein [Agreia sp. Leaf283]KQP57183.1 hypothetical protein ASF51_04745 [Agreia sp. Leaf283]